MSVWLVKWHNMALPDRAVERGFSTTIWCQEGQLQFMQQAKHLTALAWRSMSPAN